MNNEMLSDGMLKDFLRQTQRMVESGRACNPGDFYLMHISSTTDPFTDEPTETITYESLEPVVYELKGDERIVVQGGLLKRGDIVCSFPNDAGIVFSDIRKVEWKHRNYLIMDYSPYDKGLGANISRKRLFCSREG